MLDTLELFSFYGCVSRAVSTQSCPHSKLELDKGNDDAGWTLSGFSQGMKPGEKEVNATGSRV